MIDRRQTAEIHVDDLGRGEVVIDGVHLENEIAGFKLEAHVGEVARLTLEGPATHSNSFRGPVRIVNKRVYRTELGERLARWGFPFEGL